MENKKNHEFNRMNFLKQTIDLFLNQPSFEAVEKKYLLLIQSLDKNNQQYQIKMKIITDCYNFFKLSHVREQIASARKDGMSNVQLKPILARGLAISCFGDDKRHYNMSKITSKDMLSKKEPPKFDDFEKDPQKPNPYKEEPLKDLQGNLMTIQIIGKLTYKTTSSDEYLYKYRVCKEKNGTTSEVKVFSNIDINQLKENKSYYNAVMEDILSDNNIELSDADGYIGEIHGVKGAEHPLKVGEELFDKDPDTGNISGYKYQISSKYALVYDGERLEAIRTSNQIEQEKALREQSKENDR